jgi:hypothetical protein
MDEFRAIRMEALIFLGGYDLGATSEELRAKLDAFFERRFRQPLPTEHLPSQPPPQS